MMRILGFLLFCVVVGHGQSAPKKVFEPKLENGKVSVLNSAGEVIFQKYFTNPSDLFVNLSDGSVTEYLVRDKIIERGVPKYSAFIYCITDTFYLIDSVSSGVYEPAPFYSNELERTLLLTGSHEFDSLHSPLEHEYFSPVNCLLYEDGELFNANDLVYEIFLQENEQIISFVESSWSGSDKSCTTSTELKSAIAAVYVNYFNAGEKVLARQFLNDYYLCADKESFKSFLDSQF